MFFGCVCASVVAVEKQVVVKECTQPVLVRYGDCEAFFWLRFIYKSVNCIVAFAFNLHWKRFLTSESLFLLYSLVATDFICRLLVLLINAQLNRSELLNAIVRRK